MIQDTSRELLDFIRRSPSCYHAAENLCAMLREAGYTELREQTRWRLEKGGRYFVLRGGSAVLAFRVPERVTGGFLLAAAHGDSPTFKIKENPERVSAGHYIQLSTEKYGGMIVPSWFDRPLSAAGRVLVKNGSRIEARTVDLDRDLLVIPHVAIHMDRTVNDGKTYRANVDTLPLLGDLSAKGRFEELVAQAAGVPKEDILGRDLFLYCRQAGTVLGEKGEYLLSPKLDDLECAYGCMQGFLQAEEGESIPVCCVFNHEEVGSATAQGAASAFLRDTLRRIALALGEDEEGYQILLSRSFLVSADNAHAQHPNHPEYADSGNCPYLNEGIVIKFNAAQRYATDGVSCAVFRQVCEKAGVKTQVFANRSDLAGGSTLGSIADTMVPVPTVDIGLPQLAMHSAVETAGAADFRDLIAAMRVYFSGCVCAAE